MKKRSILRIIIYFIVGVSLILLGVYLAGAIGVIEKYSLLNEYPTIFVGSGAAIAALIGVFVNQFYQTLNTTKNIEASRENLQKQLNSQINIFKEQLEHQKKLQDAQLYSDKEKMFYENYKLSQKEMFQAIVELCSFIESYINESFYFNQARINYMYFYTINDSKAEIFSREQDEWLKIIKENNALIEKAKAIIAFQNYINEVGSTEIYNDFSQKIMLMEHEVLKMNILGDSFIENDICKESTERTLLQLRSLRSSAVQFLKEEILGDLYLDLLISIKETHNTSMNPQ